MTEQTNVCLRLNCNVNSQHLIAECRDAARRLVPDPVTQAERAVDPLRFLDEDGDA